MLRPDDPAPPLLVHRRHLAVLVEVRSDAQRLPASGRQVLALLRVLLVLVMRAAAATVIDVLVNVPFVHCFTVFWHSAAQSYT